MLATPAGRRDRPGGQRRLPPAHRSDGTAAEETIKSLGGKLEAFYFAFGETDAFVIANLPDHSSAAAVLLALSVSGAVRAKTTVLFTPEEMDQATRKAHGDTVYSRHADFVLRPTTVIQLRARPFVEASNSLAALRRIEGVPLPVLDGDLHEGEERC